ncbi:hypothetical protein GCM10025870_30470 [Agromyces marinus]|uniref:Bacteriocin biosynthesis cyclodehydratase domain-containing protein n=1 Tax=Agromyces marinus TaxID=1389020 RepID=A0ABM8H577_9MICO|nr:hypothetical protein GCM10025870_30470 [Agromyces marinus]
MHADDPDRDAVAPDAGRGGVVALAGPAEIVDDLGTALLRLGHRPRAEADADPATTDAAVLVGARVIPPALHLPWLSADVAHLPIVFDERGVEIGPFVRPGRGPCLRCVHLTRRDADAAWPAVAAQLAIAPAPHVPARARHDAVALAASALDDLLRTGRTRLDGSVLLVSGPRGRLGPLGPRPVAVPVHPECGCRALGGTATAPARSGARRSAPSSGSAVAVPA